MPRSMGGGLGTLKIKDTFCPTDGHSEWGGAWDLRQMVWRGSGRDIGVVSEQVPGASQIADKAPGPF
jgi:hypothetical protein